MEGLTQVGLSARGRFLTIRARESTPPLPCGKLRIAALTRRAIRATMAGMDFDDASPRMRPGDLIAQLAREDLDPLSVTELDERIIALTGEIERCRAKRDRAVNHKASAEALFKK